MRSPLDAGPTAVLTFDNFTVVVFRRDQLFDRAMYYANGCNPRDFDLIVVKSPHTEYHMYEAWAEKNFNIDAPGATAPISRARPHDLRAADVSARTRHRSRPRPVLYRSGAVLAI